MESRSVFSSLRNERHLTLSKGLLRTPASRRPLKLPVRARTSPPPKLNLGQTIPPRSSRAVGSRERLLAEAASSHVATGPSANGAPAGGTFVEGSEVKKGTEHVESWLERRVLNARFLTLAAVIGSIIGAALCFIKGSFLILESVKYSFKHFFHHSSSRDILYLVEALDVYLMGTVMLIFGIGIYELFIDSLEFSAEENSSFFGMFPLTARPKWLHINSLDEMKTKLGHVIVMILLVGIFEKSKKVVVSSPAELVMFSVSVTLAAACLIMLSRLHPPERSH